MENFGAKERGKKEKEKWLLLQSLLVSKDDANHQHKTFAYYLCVGREEATLTTELFQPFFNFPSKINR